MTRRTVLAAGLALPALACARPVPTAADPDDVEHGLFRYARGRDTIEAYVARPGNAAAPVVTVLHGNAGIPPDVRDTAIWLASLGYVGFAPDPTSREPDPSQIPRAVLLGTAYGERLVEDSRAGIDALREQNIARDSPIGIFGYCGGGYVGLMWAASAYGREVAALVGAHVATRHLRSEAHLYRRPPGIDYFRRISLPVQLHQGGADAYTPPEDIEEVRRLAAEGNKPLDLHVYPGADHGFAMHTNPSFEPRYAELIRARAAAFLMRHLPRLQG